MTSAETVDLERLDMSLDDLIGMERKAASKKQPAQKRGQNRNGGLNAPLSAHMKTKKTGGAAKRNQKGQEVVKRHVANKNGGKGNSYRQVSNMRGRTLQRSLGQQASTNGYSRTAFGHQGEHQRHKAATQRLQGNRQAQPYAGSMWTQQSYRRGGNTGVGGNAGQMQSFMTRGVPARPRVLQDAKYGSFMNNNAAALRRVATGGVRKVVGKQSRVASSARKPLTLSDRFGAYQQNGRKMAAMRSSRGMDVNSQHQSHGNRANGPSSYVADAAAGIQGGNWRQQSGGAGRQRYPSIVSKWTNDGKSGRQYPQRRGAYQVYFNRYN